MEYAINGADSSVVAEVSWTFPLEFVEVIHGDGENTFYETVSARDSAGNGALTMPMRISNQRCLR